MAPLSSPSPSMKLLLTDSRPKSKPESIAAPSNYDSSSSGAHVAQPKKRTRDRPNLFTCHCCDRRIDQDNPKDRLQTMDSIWRIVLLCRKCCKSIGSGWTCPYCFKQTGDSGDICQCTACDRKIHEGCVRTYGNYRPWCFLGVGLEGFGVCVDCWVPDLLKKSVRVCRSEKRGRVKNKAEAEDLGENVVKDTNEKVKLARNSKKPLEMTKVRNNVVDLANGSLNLLVKKDKDWNLCNGAIQSGNVAELATQPHQVMNNTSRNLRSNLFENLCSQNVVDTRIWKGFVYEKLGKRNGEGQKLEMCSSDTGNRRMKQPVDDGLINDSDESQIGLLTCHQYQKRKKWLLSSENAAVSEASHQNIEFSSHLDDDDDIRTLTLLNSSTDITLGSDDSNADEIDVSKNVDRFGKQYIRTRFKQKMCQVNGSDDLPEIATGVNGLCNDVGGSNLGLLCYKRDKKRKIWQVKDESTMISEANLQTVMFNLFNLHLDDTGVRGAMIRALDASNDPIGVTVGQCDLCTVINRFGQANGSIDISEGSANGNGLCNDVDGVNPGLLTYKRDKKRKKLLFNYENSIVSAEASQQKIKFILQLDDGQTRDSMKNGADLSKSSVNFNTDQSDVCLNVDGLDQKLVSFKSTSFSLNGSQVHGAIDLSEEGSDDVNRLSSDFDVLNIGLLPYTWDKWKIRQSNDVNSLGSEASKQNLDFNLHLGVAKTEESIMNSADISECSFDVNSHQSDLPINVDRFGLVYKRTRFKQKAC